MLVAGALAFPSVRSNLNLEFGWFGSESDDPELVLETVKRGRFRVSVTERGSLGSLKNSTLHSRVEGTTTIISIVPEGTQVSKPVPAKITGIVSEILTSGKSRRVTVVGEPIVIRTSFVTAVLPSVTVEHTVPLGEYTKLFFEENSRVEAGEFLAGDILCELDSSALVEKEKQQQIAVTQAEADLEKGRKNVEIQINQNKSDMAAAKLKLDLARLDLKKFEEGEKVQQENESKGAVLLAQEDLTLKEATLEYYRTNVQKGYRTQVELDSARQAVVKARNALAVAQDKLKVLQKYTFERTYKELKENAEESAREMKRVELTGLAALAQFQAELKARELTYSVETEKLRRFRAQIKACKLMAPQDGKVVYANQRSRRSEPVVIEEGTSVRERQAIITLPDFTQMKVEAKIHESKISNVREGLKALIKVDAVPDKTFQGVVHIVPDVPVKGEWPNTDLMSYETTVRILDDVDELKPGMAAEVEIIAEDREDVLQVPIQAILAIGDKFAAFVKTKNGVELRQDIIIGSSNDKMIEVKSGLEEGEQVVMNPKSRFPDQINELRAKTKAEMLDRKAEPRARKKRGPAAKGAARMGAKKRKKQGKRPGNAGGPPSPAQIIKSLDKNGDNKISKDEAPDRMKGNFDRMDANKDGAIDAAELRKAFSRGPGGGGRR